ncbi:hypothetical protein [Leptolyngbya ohadii]|uniref:hypothetical protein n=1 Tax=Leptolyngbya ohadii TaxID=1962290 RepID=UPI000B59D4AC|nr:hypothetical protein [Leptolyngbya ohadii]
MRPVNSAPNSAPNSAQNPAPNLAQSRRFPIRPKLLLFYGGTIAAVLVLFRLITAYGETQLQAAPKMGGVYLSLASPPGCSSDLRLKLTVQQSGIFLNGATELVQATSSPTVAHSASSERLPLTGRWQQNQLSLSGRTDAFTACGIPANSTVTVQGTIAFGNQLAAKMQVNGNSTWSFQGDRQETVQQEAH